MRITLLVLVLTSLFTCSFAQEEPEKMYYDVFWSKVEKKKDASYYRIMENKNDTTYVVRDYYVSGKPFMTGHYKSVNPEIKHGVFTFYYEKKDQIKEEGAYINDFKTGTWKKYFESGKLKSERVYNGRPDVFTTVDKMPEFKGGMDSLYLFIANNIKYPEFARDSKIQGTVYVSFIVDKDGAIKNIEVVRGIGGGCDDAAFNVVQKMPFWIPGMKDNEPVKVKYVLPLTFRL